MDKITLKHISAYLPYEVKFISEMDKPYDEYGAQPIWTLNGINEMFSEYCLITKESIDAYPISKCKIRLRPLSDLTKEIEHNGEKFVPIDYINGEFRLEIPNKIELQNWVKNKSIHFVLAEWVDIKDLYKLFKLLFQWHFDLHGLIDKGLAVDINTLKGETK